MALIRCYLEYACVIWDPHLLKDACVVWDPYLLKDTCAFKKVHKFALRVCSGIWNTGYDSLLDQFNTTTLSRRRKTLKLICNLYRILLQLSALHCCPVTFRANPYSSRCSNKLQLAILCFHSNSFKFSFFVHACVLWNHLPFALAVISSYTSFKKCLLSVT